MELEFDPEKSLQNEARRGLAFDRVADLDWSSTVVWKDDRKNYGEERFSLLGLLDGRVHALVYCIRNEVIRVISFRKANAREVIRYEEGISRKRQDER